MCNPVLIGAATAALAVGGAVVDHIGTNQMAAATTQAANLDYANRSDIIEQQRVQLDQEKSTRVEDSAIASAQASGRIAASAADKGLGYASTSQALHAEFFGIGRQDSIADANDLNQRVQLSNERRGAAISREAKIASAPRSGLLNLGLGVGKGVFSGFNAYNSASKAGN
jgi:hypothetical protein